MKKLLLLILLVLLPIMAFAMASRIEVRDDLFHSEKELSEFPHETVRASERSFYDNIQISLLTGGPGSEIWENFGHTAMVVTVADGTQIAFDYGIFTFNSTFYTNFALGKLYYECAETYAPYRINALINEDRSVSILPLDLTAEQKKDILNFLLYNAEDQNKTYLYDYFEDNCATRLRDIYSWSTGNRFQEFLQGKESKETIRDYVTRYLFRSTFVPAWTLNYLLGPSVDRPITMWEACFLPDVLNEMVEEFQTSKAEVLYESQHRRSVPAHWSLPLRSVLFGAVLALLAYLSTRRRKGFRVTANLLLGVVYLFFTVISTALLFMTFFTIHRVTHGNLSWLLISPFSLWAAILHFRAIGRKPQTEGIRRYSLAAALVASATGIALLFLPQNATAVLIPSLMLYLSEYLFHRM